MNETNIRQEAVELVAKGNVPRAYALLSQACMVG